MVNSARADLRGAAAREAAEVHTRALRAACARPEGEQRQQGDQHRHAQQLRHERAPLWSSAPALSSMMTKTNSTMMAPA